MHRRGEWLVALVLLAWQQGCGARSVPDPLAPDDSRTPAADTVRGPDAPAPVPDSGVPPDLVPGDRPAGPCVAVDAGSSQPTCKGLALRDPRVEDDSGDGKVSPGEGATLRVTLAETAGLGNLSYPGVRFATDNPAVTVTDSNWLFGILPCTEVPIPVRATFGASLAPGTVVTVTATAGLLTQACTGGSLAIPITIR